MKIDKNIPLPEKRIKYPFKTMETGDSFLVSCDRNNRKELRRISTNILCSARLFKNKRFTTRRVNEGIRCWRFE